MSAITDKTAKHIEEFWSTYSSVTEELSQQGVVIPPRPEFDIPVVTADLLTTLDDKEYTRVFAEKSQWSGYVQMLLAHYEAQLADIAATTKHTAAAIRASAVESAAAAGEKKLTPSELKDVVQLDPNWLRAERWRIRTQSMRNITDNKLKTLKSDVQLISRQVEIRRQEKEQFRIENNMPTRGYTPQRD